MPSAIVVGAGLAGLNCAITLIKKNFDVLVLEKSDRVGGRVTTDYVDGFQLDRGFQVINPAYAELKRLNLVAKLDLQTIPKGFHIELSEKSYLVGDPRCELRFVRGDISPATGSVREKLAFLNFLLTKHSQGTFSTSMKNCGRFYSEVLKGFLDGVFLTDSNQVSSEVAHETLRWFVKGNPGVPAKGVAELPRLMAVDVDVRMKSEVVEVHEGRVDTDQGSYHADAIVIAANPNSTQHLLNLPELQMNSSWTWYHSVNSNSVQSPYLKVLRNNPFINSVAISNIAPQYAPQGSTLISSTSLKPLREREANEAVAKAWSLNLSDLRNLACYEIKGSLPFHGPHKTLQTPQRISDRIVAAGDAFAFPSQQGALKSGRLAAEMIIAGQ
jgi:phytoene dehydrogenase-like protein